MKAVDIIKSLVRLAGSVTGIILISVGSVLILNSVLKVYVFGIETGMYFNPENIRQCERLNPDSSDFDQIAYAEESASVNVNVEVIPGPGKIKELTEEERKELERKYTKCIDKNIESEKKQYKKGKLDFLADGIAFLIVGSVILFFYRNRKNSI